MNHSFLRKLTYFVLVLLMVTAMIPAFAFSASAADNSVTLSFAGGSGTNLDPIEFTNDENGVSAVFTAGTHSTKPRWDSSLVRFYGTMSASNNLTFSAPDGATITEIVFSMNGSYGLDAVSSDSGEIDKTTKTWTGSANSIIFTTTAQTRIEGATVTYSSATVGGHTHNYVWNNVVGADGNHTLKCLNADGLCTTLEKNETCKWNVGEITSYPDCETEGVKTITCTVCGATKTEAVEMTDHNYVDGFCADCGAEEPAAPSYGNLVAEFQFGDNGKDGHSDGSTISNGQAYTSGKYTLTLDTLSKVYGSAFDAKCNSALKLGTSSATASLTFTVPADVTTVVINIAGYKKINAGVDVNGTEYTIETLSDNGEYTAIEVNTSTNKTIKLNTISSGKRAMIDSIKFYIPEGDASCTHTNREVIPAVAPSCTTIGYTEGLKCSDCGFSITAPESVDATGHTVVDGSCTTCGTKINYTIPEALEAADKTAVVVTGTVYLINDDSWTKYGNMSVTIQDADGNELYIYRLATQVTVGDIITVTGEMGTHDDQRRINQGATAVITGHEEVEIIYEEVTIPEILESADDRLVTFSATVTKVDGVKVTVTDEGGNTILLYKPQTEIALYDVITIKGVVDTYNGTKQIASATAEITGNIAPKINSVSLTLNKGVTVNVKINISAAFLKLNPNAMIEFSNGDTAYAREGLNTYSATLTPGQINDTLKVTVAEVNDDVSVTTYKSKVESSSIENKDKIIAILEAALKYAEAADQTSGDIEESFDGITDMTVSDKIGAFEAVNATLNESIDVNIKVNTSAFANDEYTLKLTLANFEINGSIEQYITKEGRIVITDLFPVDFNENIFITISDSNGEEVASATFTVNQYLKALYNSTNDQKTMNMAAATYQYGIAAEAYIGN